MRVATLPLLIGAACLHWAAAQSDPDSQPGLGTGVIGESGTVRGTLDPGSGEPPVTLAIIGDFGSRTPAQKAVAAMLHSWQPDAVLTVGDNNYLAIEPTEIMDTSTDGRPLTGWQLAVGEDFGAFIARRHDGAYPEQRSPLPRLFPSVGNHDRREGPTAPEPLKGYYDYFHDNPGGRPRLPVDRDAVHSEHVSYYVVRLGPVDCFMLDSNPPAENSEAAAELIDTQRRWLAAQVAASTARWKIACFHHAPYGSGSYGGHTRMRWPEFARLDALFCGHDHLYERLICNEDGSDQGPILIITGNGGARLYPFRTIAPQSRVRHADAYGALQLLADDTGLSLDAWSVDPESGARRELDSTTLGSPAKRDHVDDYWFHAPAGLTVEAAVTMDSPSASAPIDLEFWGPDGTRAASGPSPLRLETTQAGRWRVRLRARAGNPVAYSLSLKQPDRESFADWQKRRLAGSRTRPSTATADPDRDGLDNATEFALGTDPRSADPAAPGVTVAEAGGELIEVLVSLPLAPPDGWRLHLEERLAPAQGGQVQWLERLVLAPWQPRAGIEAWEERPAAPQQPAPTLRWQRVRGPAGVKPPVFRWRTSQITAP